MTMLQDEHLAKMESLAKEGQYREREHDLKMEILQLMRSRVSSGGDFDGMGEVFHML